MFKKLPPLEDIKKTFYYKDGKLFYINNVCTWVRAGDEAGCIHKNTGYCSVSVNGQRYQAHRIIWKLLKKEDPVGEIDHINGNRSDNRINNLRSVCKSANLKNQKRYKNNRSGMSGVYWNKQKQKWCVQVTNNGEQRYFGCFKDLEEAKKVRLREQKKSNFHKNHGREI